MAISLRLIRAHLVVLKTLGTFNNIDWFVQTSNVQLHNFKLQEWVILFLIIGEVHQLIVQFLTIKEIR